MGGKWQAVRLQKRPRNCSECPVALSGKYCRINKTYTTYRELPIRPDHCPLVELPEKHGRLIDADALHVLFENQWHYLQCLNWDENPKAEEKQTGINWCINTLHDDATTIIEAEGDKE